MIACSENVPTVFTPLPPYPQWGREEGDAATTQLSKTPNGLPVKYTLDTGG
jgi:hypothetical protein